MNNDITWQQLRLVLIFAVPLIAVIVFLANISSSVNELKDKSQAINSKVDIIDQNQIQTETDIAVIKQILQHNNLSSVSTGSNKSTPVLTNSSSQSKPNLTPQYFTPIQHTTTYTYSQPTPQPSPQPAPTSIISLPCILELCP